MQSSPSRSAPRSRACVVTSAALVIGACLIACSGSDGDSPSPRAPVASQVLRSARLGDGAVVELRCEGKRIVAASSSVVDFLGCLLPPARFAGLPEQAFDYSELRANAVADSAESLAWDRVPRFAAFLAEDMIALAPDLVVAEPWQDQNTIERLREADIEVIVLPEVKSYDDARTMLLGLGQLLDVGDKAAETVDDLDRRVARLREGAPARSTLRVMCYSNFGASGWSAGSGTTIDEQIRLAGMRNATAELGRVGHVQVSFEELIAIDPDVIIVQRPLRESGGTQGDRGGASEAILRGEPSLSGLRAVRDSRIVSLPPSLFATGSHALVRGAEVLSAEVDAIVAAPAANSSGGKRP